MLAGCVVLVVVLVLIVVLVIANARQHDARYRLLVEERWQLNGFALIVVLEDQFLIVIIGVARVTDDRLRLVGEPRCGIVEIGLGAVVGLLALVVADDGGEHARQCVDLMGAKWQARGEVRLVGPEHAFETERQCVAPAVVRRRRLQSLGHLLDGVEVGTSPDGAATQLDGLALGDDAFTDPALHVVKRRGSRRLHELRADRRITGFEHPSLQPPSSAGTTDGRLLDCGSSVPDGTELT